MDNHKSDAQGVSAGAMTALPDPKDGGGAGLPKTATVPPAGCAATTTSGQGPHAPGRLTNALVAWQAEAGVTPVGLEEIRLDQNERLLVPFTTSIAPTTVHSSWRALSNCCRTK